MWYYLYPIQADYIYLIYLIQLVPIDTIYIPLEYNKYHGN